jgi:hypothetical protein
MKDSILKGSINPTPHLKYNGKGQNFWGKSGEVFEEHATSEFFSGKFRNEQVP